MKKLLIIVFLFLLASIPQNINAKMPRLSSQCLEKIKDRNEQFNKLNTKDIIASLDLNIEDNNYFEVTEKDLDAAHLIYGGKEDDDYYQSLHKQFMVASRGKPSLFIKPEEAYFLYKKPDHTNVAVHFKLSDTKWEEADTKKNKGNPIPFKILKCEKEYLKKKTDYYVK